MPSTDNPNLFFNAMYRKKTVLTTLQKQVGLLVLNIGLS
jgi:hypothetical protein